METAVAYIRVSSQRQVDEGGSLESQLKLVERHAMSNGYRLIEIFREEGESAKTDQRPELQALLMFCREKKNGVSVVVVPKIDRLARNVIDYTNFKVQLIRLGVRIDSIGERIEDTPVGRFTETILASVAQFDNEVRAERSKGGMIDAVTQGRWVWKAPLGYRLVRVNGKGTIEPDPTTGPIVVEGFRRIASGLHKPSLVLRYFRKQGIEISPGGFYKMLSREVYLARMHVFGRIFEAQPPFVPLVDEVTFRKAQRVLGKQKSGPRKYERDSEDFPLRGTMICTCSQRYTAGWSTGAHKRLYGYYQCKRCKGRSLRKLVVEGHFLVELGSYRGRPDAWERLLAALLKLDGKYDKASAAMRTGHLKHIEELQSLRDAVAMKNVSGVLSDDVAIRQIQRLTEQIQDIAAKIPANPHRVRTAELIDFAVSFFGSLKQTWPSLTLKTKKDLLRFMFPNGILYLPHAGFRNSFKAVSERLKHTVSESNSTLVDPDSDALNELRTWLEELYHLMSPEFKSESIQSPGACDSP